MAFNYAGFAAMVGVGHLLRRKDSAEWVVGSAMVGSLLFFLLSNFGCWLDPLLKYDRSFSGLLNCYGMAFYFFRYTLASDILFTLLFVGIHRVAVAYSAESARASSET
jgi:hypothetical protein